MKVHIRENGYALCFFFENVLDTLHSELVKVMEARAGDAGNVRILAEAEVAHQVLNDLHFKTQKRESLELSIFIFSPKIQISHSKLPLLFNPG